MSAGTPDPVARDLTPIAPVPPRVVHLPGVCPERDAIYRLAHLQPARPAHRRWVVWVDQLLTQLPRLTRPRGLLRIDAVTALEPRRIVLADGTTYEGALGAFLAHSRLVATYIVTIGSALERLARGWLRAGKVMQGTLADAVASVSVEALSDRLHEQVRQWARARGLDVTPPYSPGYCGLSVQQQRPLFASLPAHRINVRLTDSCLMLPVKSISGLIGIGPPDKVRPGAYPCEACDHPDCMQRRAPLAAKHVPGNHG